MGDDDKLRVPVHLAQIGREPRDVHVVQRRLDFVQHAEGRRIDLHDGEIQGDGDQSLLPSGERLQAGDGLAGQPDGNFDSGAEHVVRVRQGEGTRAPAEQVAERLGEVAVNLVEPLGEQVLHLAGQTVNQPVQLVAGFFGVRNLRLQKLVAGRNLLVFLHGGHVHRAERADFAFQLIQALFRLSRVADIFRRLPLGFAAGQFIFFP